MRRPILHTLVVSALVLVAACSAPRGTTSKDGQRALTSGESVDWNVTPPPRSVTGNPARVKYFAFASGKVFELVNESHTNPHEFYSKKRPIAEAFTKIQSDEVLQALLSRLADLGAVKKTQPGAAPAYPAGSKAQALEIETGEGLVHWLVTDRSSAADRTLFMRCANDFVQLYNETVQMQSVDEAPEWRGASQGRPSGTYKEKGSSSGKVP